MCDIYSMTEQDIKLKIRMLTSRLKADHYDHDKHEFVPATGQTRQWLLSSIETLKAELPRARHDDQVAKYGFASVERNV